MPKLTDRLPKKCRDRNQAFSWHNGKRIYHGVWGTPEADSAYKRFITALLENPVIPPRDNRTDDVLVSELADAFLVGNESRIGKTEFPNYKYAIGYLAEIYGELAVNEFSPKKLKVCRDQMIKTGTLCRKTINRSVGHTSANMTKRYSRAQLKQREKLALTRRNLFAVKEGDCE